MRLIGCGDISGRFCPPRADRVGPVAVAADPQISTDAVASCPVSLILAGAPVGHAARGLCDHRV